MRTRTLARSGSFAFGPRRVALLTYAAAVRDRFRAEGKPVPGINAVVKWMLSKRRTK